ncbi:TetR/AcrR family transcriptional regulator [Actinomadura parmotrematis]|uniref:TetR/AcrR family transcriptional regulator n=1 Tax=Actinomadura parmotrematis TaxID=2864039 RepID=A0ABS7G7S8_9ACTN|nr:TetR/AcrR family transcriptional regulator [Actinomadura parmotrematis]MBW8487688.1 TetR/AcrR family transcriptional regulator [Actinomadura parmotrematis]
MSEAVRSPRERYRRQVREEIKTLAWEQVATTGASALSLNAIAKRMGMSGPALYRYFGSRDELITELVLDAYRDLSGTCRTAADGPTAPEARLSAVATALRTWALDAPHRYLLIFGTPVPGYAGPPEATEIAAELMSVLLNAFAGEESAGEAGAKASAEKNAKAPPEAPPETGAETDAETGAETGAKAEAKAGAQIGAASDGGSGWDAARALESHLAGHRTWVPDSGASEAALRRALTFWTRLHGVISLEVAGHFTGMGFDPALLYAAETEAAVHPAQATRDT